ncbi:2-oxoacid dehydrogenases acyltransferase (catalytic domain) [Actinomadura meyerae]|uniref:2-oxoacid dehydrogenases acyltransferase (Catalytic domain) n=1 Tax=Actinomadura meyerae TaxID=240840 RepID=A0A239P1D6_9ACTN|nr:2-oxo acid dehydrogenase subunit E2 [Actinomadura meyerae]SNT60820.1 2-oxoacid dehydrogenases acyltransferase (catalytic domain) [Actinomadura meyerae]
MSGTAFPRQRRHTLHFLEEIRGFSPVFLDTEADMSRVLAHRSGAERRRSIVTYVVWAAGRVLARHPDANSAIAGRFSPRVARCDGVHAKIALDKALGGRRVVLSTVLRDVEHAGLDDIQREIERFRDGDADTMPEFAGIRTLQRLPVPVGRAAFRRVVRPLRNRPDRFGTFAVSSLGHRPVDGFHSVGGTTVTLGLGQVRERPVVRGGAVLAAPTLRLSLAFDHRVIDGAEAADVLAEIKDALESVPEPAAVA